MSRSALSQGRKLERGPRKHADAVPAISVVVGSMLSMLPIMSNTGWWPDFGLLMLLAWRLLRADAWPAWWAAPLGFVNDLLAGYPIGLSVFIWSAIMIAMDVLDRRTMWRDYWIEWAIAGLLIGVAEIAQWRAAAIMGASTPFRMTTGPAILFSCLAFPLAALIANRLDRWRLRR
nr:rod shape-determining protein MreD [uncultured Sphingomonas sp.]